MKTPQEAFTQYLSDENLKMTPQRGLILECILEQTQHLSPEEIYDMVRKRDGSVGQATVYRTLKLLAEAGIIESLDFADGVARYEVAWGKEHHDHLICESCGKNIEIMDPVIEKRQEAIAEEYGFKLSHHKMYLYGLCSDCRRNR